MKKINWTLAFFLLFFVVGMFVGTTSSNYHGTRGIADFAGLVGSGVVYGFIGSLIGLLIDFFNNDLSRNSYQKRLIVVLACIVVMLSIIAATLFFTGYFSPKSSSIDSESINTESNKNEVKIDKNNNQQSYEKKYLQFDKELMVRVSGSNKVLVIQVAIMTHYDNRVFDNIKKHEFALRSGMLDVMRQTTEADVTKVEYRKHLANKIKDVLNELLEKYEDFGGVEDVFFTSFVVQ